MEAPEHEYRVSNQSVTFIKWEPLAILLNRLTSTKSNSLRIRSVGYKLLIRVPGTQPITISEGVRDVETT